jgi:hypothetical protein
MTENKKIEWCKLGYTEQESKKKCPFGGCWKYRCINSTLNAKWHEDREKWRKQRREETQ